MQNQIEFSPNVYVEIMICRLCLKDISEVIKIFDVLGLELNVAMVLRKYFWFEPKNDDPISTVICNTCWIHVSDFHDFYLSVEEAHRLLTERFSIKTEDKSNQRDRPVEQNLPITVKVSKSESEHLQKQCPEQSTQDVLKDDEEEIHFSVLLEEDDNGYIDSADDDQINTTSQKVFVSEVQEANTESEEIVHDRKYNEVSFDEHYFVEKILHQAQHLDDEEDKLMIKEEPSEVHELRRSARQKNAKSNVDDSHTDKITEICKSKRKKGRPRKASADILETKCQNKLSISAKCHAKELKSQANDEKIAGYMRLICHICTEEVSTFAKLRHHFTRKHQQTAYVMCCNKKFYKRVLLVEHIDKHINPECYKCTECNKIFADKQCLRNHMLLKHQPDEVKTFECEHCPKKFAKPYLLEQHIIVHASRDHICDVCQKGFPGASQLASHMKVTHSSSYGTMCHICAKLIRGRAAFERHQLEHTGVKLPKVQCEKCGSWHKDKYSLQKHRRRHNDEGTLHVCNICSKVAPNRSALLSHFRYVHAAERTYECSVCKKAFKKPLNLKEHMTMHTGEVLYSCPYCPKTFNSNANMHSHRKKVHPREFEEQRRLRRGINVAEVGQQKKNLNAENVTSLCTEELDDTAASIAIYTAS